MHSRRSIPGARTSQAVSWGAGGVQVRPRLTEHLERRRVGPPPALVDFDAPRRNGRTRDPYDVTSFVQRRALKVRNDAQRMDMETDFAALGMHPRRIQPTSDMHFPSQRLDAQNAMHNMAGLSARQEKAFGHVDVKVCIHRSKACFEISLIDAGRLGNFGVFKKLIEGETTLALTLYLLRPLLTNNSAS